MVLPTVVGRGDFVPGTNNRTVTITGPTASAQMAQFFINNKLQAAKKSSHNARRGSGEA